MATKKEEEEKKKKVIKQASTPVIEGATGKSIDLVGGERISESVEVSKQRLTEQKGQRREEVVGALGSEGLREGLQEQILNPPTLKPEPLVERGAEAGLVVPAAIGGFLGERLLVADKFQAQTPEELASTKIGKAIGLVSLGAQAAIAVAVASPLIAAAAARSVIIKAIAGKGGSVIGLRAAIEGLSLFIVGKGVLDINGGEMDTYRKSLGAVVEDGERIEAANRNGFPTGDTIELLTTMADEVSFAEKRIHELGNNNIQYRVSKEYIDDSSNVRSAREALLRRVLAVENIAITGQAALRPEELMLDVARFEEEKE